MGEMWISLCDEPLDHGAVHEFLSGDPGLGGIVTFVGATRAERNDAHGALVRLEYDSYEPMAISEMERLAHLVCRRCRAERVAIVHRVGPVAPGEASVILGAACRHRAEAFDACRWLIDSLKSEVPIWKRDVFEDGFTRWVDPNAP